MSHETRLEIAMGKGVLEKIGGGKGKRGGALVRADMDGNFLMGNLLCREGKVDVNANDENRVSG